MRFVCPNPYPTPDLLSSRPALTNLNPNANTNANPYPNPNPNPNPNADPNPYPNPVFTFVSAHCLRRFKGRATRVAMRFPKSGSASNI